MLVRLTSSTSGTMVMFATHAHVLFGWMGKEGTAKGVFTEEQIPDALVRLQRGVEEEKQAIQRRAEEKEKKIQARRDGQAWKDDSENGDQDDPDEGDEKSDDRRSAEPVNLVQRAQPLIRLMEWTRKEGGYILWEADRDF